MTVASYMPEMVPDETARWEAAARVRTTPEELIVRMDAIRRAPRPPKRPARV
jgi:hypothetical protein